MFFLTYLMMGDLTDQILFTSGYPFKCSLTWETSNNAGHLSLMSLTLSCWLIISCLQCAKVLHIKSLMAVLFFFLHSSVVVAPALAVLYHLVLDSVAETALLLSAPSLCSSLEPCHQGACSSVSCK